MSESVVLAILAVIGAAVTGLTTVVMSLLRQRAAREIREREERQVFMKFLTNDYHETLQSIMQYMGAQTEVLKEIREDLRDLRRRP